MENIMNNEGTDKAPLGEKRVFIVGDSIIKHIMEQQSDAWKTM